MASIALACGACATSAGSSTGSGGAVDVGAADTTATSDAASPADSAQADATVAAIGPTYHVDIKQILALRCTGCHTSGGVGPFGLDNYAMAKAMAGSGVTAIDERRMPPWSAWDTPSCKPLRGWKHDLRLTAAERKALGDWTANGSPEGDSASAKPIAPGPSLNLSAPDVTAAPKAPYVASGAKDQMRCFVLDAQLDQKRYLNGTQVLPGNPLVVHHVLLFVDPNNSSAKLANKDGQYDCFGSPGLDQQGNLIAAWAPGSVPMQFPEGMGAELPKGSKIVMQVHYHPNGGVAASDLTKVQLRYVKGEPTMLGDTVLIGNAPSGQNGEGLLPGPNDSGGKPQFVIPANVKDHTEEMLFTIPAAMNGKAMPQLKIYAVGTHMHYVGRSMQISVERSPPKAPCTEAVLGPLGDCLQKACPGKAGMELAMCAQAACKGEVAAIDGLCGECLQKQVIKGTPQDQIGAACTAVPPGVTTGPAQECLLETPNWDFNWQRIYVYDTAIDQLPVLGGGDKLRLKCTYDNTLGNPFVAKALKDEGKAAPITVKLGETTLDEMCLAVVQVLHLPGK